MKIELSEVAFFEVINANKSMRGNGSPSSVEPLPRERAFYQQAQIGHPPIVNDRNRIHETSTIQYFAEALVFGDRSQAAHLKRLDQQNKQRLRHSQ